MAHENTILEIMQKIVIADLQTVAGIMEAKGIWKAGDSTYQNVHKCLIHLVKEGQLVKGKNYYKIPSCKSEYQEHAQLLSAAIAEILKLEDE